MSYHSHEGSEACPDRLWPSRYTIGTNMHENNEHALAFAVLELSFDVSSPCESCRRRRGACESKRFLWCTKEEVDVDANSYRGERADRASMEVRSRRFVHTTITAIRLILS
jgi:hypothetical protein